MGTRARQHKPRETPFLRAGAAPPAAEPAISNPVVKVLLLLLGAALLSLSFAPIKQFYLAPFGLVPWLVVLNACKTRSKALLWSWLAGVLFFAANMWWLVFVTIPGAAALMVILGLYWAAAGWLIRAARLLPGPAGWRIGIAAGINADEKLPRSVLRMRPALRPLLSVFGIAVAWIAVSEWLRATWPFGGLPWLFLGYTQTPAVIACQIADITGAYGVSFCIALVNAWVALFLINRLSSRNLRPAGAVVLTIVLAVLGYGWYRLDQKTTYPGPTVLVVQSNYPQSNTGDKGAGPVERVNFHLDATMRALASPDAHVDMVVWSETMVPPLDEQARNFWRWSQRWSYSDRQLGRRVNVLDEVQGDILDLVKRSHAAFLVGAEFEDYFRTRTPTFNSSNAPPGTRLPPGTVIAPDTVLPYGTLVPMGDILPEGTTVPRGISLPPDLFIPPGAPVPSNLPPGVVIPDGTVILPGTVLPPGTVITYGTRFPEYFATDVRNSAFYFERVGRQSDVRYDKIHRVPFGEYIPFKETIPPLYHLLVSLGPPDMEDYQLRGGDPSHATVFTLPQQQPGTPWRFVTPICFEDIDGPLVAWMFRKPAGYVGDVKDVPAFAPKQADFIVNLTNDGWFKANEMPQHLQAAVFRSIEERAPTARSVNTGISGFIDSLGRIDPNTLIPAGTEGTKIATLQLDRRTTFYTHWGDVFADLCAAAAGIMAVVGVVRWWLAKHKRQE